MPKCHTFLYLAVRAPQRSSGASQTKSLGYLSRPAHPLRIILMRQCPLKQTDFKGLSADLNRSLFHDDFIPVTAIRAIPSPDIEVLETTAIGIINLILSALWTLTHFAWPPFYWFKNMPGWLWFIPQQTITRFPFWFLSPARHIWSEYHHPLYVLHLEYNSEQKNFLNLKYIVLLLEYNIKQKNIIFPS